MRNKIWKVIPALDVTDLERIRQLITQVDGHELIYGYKIGFSLGLTFGLPQVVRAVREISAKPVIYDHQKAATDIPDTGRLFAEVMKQAGMDEVILFPQAGPVTEEAWIKAVQDQGMKVIVGGIMTHPGYLESEGGYLKDAAVSEMYRLAYRNGVRDFVVPLTKPEATRAIYQQAGLGDDCRFYSPGYGKQGGDPAAFDFLGEHYVIIGRALLNAEEPRAFLDEVRSELEK